MTLYRAYVVLPRSMTSGFVERAVFFEGPPGAAAYRRLCELLALTWGVEPETWEDGEIYNLFTESELRGHAGGADDTALFECSWGPGAEVGYLGAARVDLFVSPRWRARLDRAIAAIAHRATAATV
jgi:hypothetical protein